jgi:hypothetical protein
MTDDDSDDPLADIDAITAAFLDGDIGEALRLVALRLDRNLAELRQPGLDAARRADLMKSIRFCQGTRERLLV